MASAVRRRAGHVVCGILFVLWFPCGLAAVPFGHRLPGNLLKNSSFEHDWIHRAFAMDRRFLLLQASDMGVGESDGRVDHWRFEGVESPGCWDTAAGRSGARSIRFDRPGHATQLIRFAGEQYWRDGGAYYNDFLPMAEPLATQLARRPIIAGAWCKTDGVPEGGEPGLYLRIDCAARADFERSPSVRTSAVTGAVAFSAGTHGWEYREIRIDPSPAPEGRPHYDGTPFLVTISIDSPGKGGVAWFDDVSCVEDPSLDPPDRLPNGGFEALAPDGWAAGWLRAVPWSWFRRRYYLFTGWSHGDSERFRGGARIDDLLAFRGRRSLCLTILPGDQLAVRSAPIRLDQPSPRPIEVRAMVKADNLRTIEILASDETGEWLPQGDFLGDDMEEPGHYTMGSTGCGTYDWSCVRKYFSPRRPVKEIVLWLCARGFDGRIVEKNLVGTVWFDDVRLLEHGAAGSAAPPPAASASTSR